MKINKKNLSIPPYLSTSWEYIAALRLQNTDLLITMIDGETITIPNLSPEILETVFNNHIIFLEEREDHMQAGGAPSFPLPAIKHPLAPTPLNAEETLFKIGFGSPSSMNAAMQHNSELSHSPDLPREVLDKIGAISKIIAPEDVVIPKAEPHCNCPYCQIARAIHTTIDSTDVKEEKKEDTEEEVSEEELRFQEWSITQSGDKLFTVVNKLDSQEKYSVYLGHPVGCTCGKEGCEHILAVLKS